MAVDPQEGPAPLPRRHRAHITNQLAYRGKTPRTADPAELPLLDTRDGPPPWPELVPPGKPVELEIGPGKGRFLLAAARARPETFFLGVEAARPFALYTADRIKRAGLENALVLHDDAAILLAEDVPPGALQALHVYFPDPWPKRRHRVLAPGGRLYLATDEPAYFGEILALLGPSPLFRRLPGAPGEGPPPPEVAFGPTNFEVKYRRQGRPIHRCAWCPVPCNGPAGA
jgi:tRNA (guanine-N7-)-methyltransferase